MPVLAGIPWLVPLLTGVAAATSIGTTAYGLSQGSGGGSSSSQVQALQTQAQQQQAQLAAQQKAAFLAAQPQVQSSTSGSLVGNALNTQTATQAGVPTDLNSIAQYLKTGSSGSSPISGGTTTPNSATAAQEQAYLPGLASQLFAS